MTDVRPGRRRMLIGLLCTASCAGLGLLVALGTAPTAAVPALLVLLLPVGIVPLGVVLDLLFQAGGLPGTGGGQAAFVVLVAVSAVLQVRLFRAVARTWHPTGPFPGPAPGVREARRTGSF